LIISNQNKYWKKEYMNKVKDLKISEYIKGLSSSSPTPGGGATAALTGVFAASLVEMVCNLTLGKEKYKKYEKDIFKIRKEVSQIRESLLKLVDEDINAFNRVMKAYGLKDKEKIQSSLINATEVPLKTAGYCGNLIVLARKVSKIGNKNAVSDAKSAYHLAKAGKLSAYENVKINLKYIKDKEYVLKVEEKIAEINRM